MLAPIIIGVGLIRANPSIAETGQMLELMERSANRGAELIKQVLSFARGIEGPRSAMSVKHLMREVQGLACETFPKAIAITTDIAPDIRDVFGNMTQLHQVLLNLAVNARDAMPTGGKLSFVARNLELDEGYAAMHREAQPGWYVVLSVTDTGVGIPRENLEKIFDPFFSTKEPGRGTGLGLSTAYAIVKGHRGFISIYSEVGKGTEARVYLPAASGDAAGAAPRRLEKLPPAKGEHILVIDDEEAVATVVLQALQRHGYTAQWARNGAEGVAAYAKANPKVDLVLTDMAMPVMDGPSTILALRSIDPKVRVIGASGLGSNGKFVHALGAGVRHFLQKPYTIEALFRTMRTALDEEVPDENPPSSTALPPEPKPARTSG